MVANVSHDLRTPLSIIRGYVETVLMKENNLTPEERKKYLKTILGSTDRLLKLVEELFELSKLEAKDKVLQLEEFSIAELLHDIHQKNILRTKKKGVKLNLDVDENLPLIKGDIGMMEKVFQNLIDNALKFTRENSEISIIAKKEIEKLNLTIKDTGAGIEKANCRIFLKSTIKEKELQIIQTKEQAWVRQLLKK